MCNYKGMLYPLQLDSAENGNSARGVKIEESTKPLVDLCSEKIVLDGSSTLRAFGRYSFRTVLQLNESCFAQYKRSCH